MDSEQPLPAQESASEGRGGKEPLLICADELAQLLGVSTRTLWRLRSSGQLIEPIKLGGNTRWRLSEVHQWIADGCPPPQQ